jgi:hypothetical protein
VPATRLAAQLRKRSAADKGDLRRVKGPEPGPAIQAIWALEAGIFHSVCHPGYFDQPKRRHLHLA